MPKELDIHKIFTILKFVKHAITTTCNSHDKGQRPHGNDSTESSIEDYLSAFQKTGCFLFNPFPANIPHMSKPGSWFLLAKYVKKHLCKKEVWPASLRKTSLFHRCFFIHFARKNQLLGLPINGTLGKWVNSVSKTL